MELDNWQTIRELIKDVYRANAPFIEFDTDLAIEKGYSLYEKAIAERVIIDSPNAYDSYNAIIDELAQAFKGIDKNPRICYLPEVKLILLHLDSAGITTHVFEEELETKFTEIINMFKSVN